MGQKSSDKSKCHLCIEIDIIYIYILKLGNHQIRHKATHKVVCQPGDFAYGYFNFLEGFVWVYMG